MQCLTKDQKEDLNLRYKSQGDLYQFLSIVRKYFHSVIILILVDLHLPARNQCSLNFLQQLIEGKKQMIERVRVNNVKVPAWPELAVSKLLPDVMEDPTLKHFFEDKYPRGKVPDRKYFWGVINAIKPGYYKLLVDDALRQRASIAKDSQEEQKALHIKNEVLKKLLDCPSWLKSKKSGRSLVFSKAAPRKCTKKREFKVLQKPNSHDPSMALDQSVVSYKRNIIRERQQNQSVDQNMEEVKY